MSLISVPIFGLGSRTTASASVFRRSGILYDYGIAGIGLLAANSKEYPFSRQTTQFRKEQFDNSANPGEQTLTGWWLRAQSTFSGGAGIKFMEPASDSEIMSSFAESVGVNVWTPGQATLLKTTSLKNATAGDCLVMGAIASGVDSFYHAEGATLTREYDAGSSAVTWGGAGTILSMTNDGGNYYAADSTGIYKGTITGGAGSLVWNTGSSNVVLGWAKQRLVAGIGNSIYELTTGGPALPTALYTHPSSAWIWTGIAEGGSAIYAAGYNGTESAIYKFVLSNAGVMPTLTSGIIAARLPTGERVHSIEAYLGSYIAIGTNKGVRIGVILDNGDIAYGPLTIESTQPVYDLVGRDRFIYATCTDQIDGRPGLWRIDLGSPLEDGSFPYATDLQTWSGTGTVNSVTVFGASDRMVIGVSGRGSFLESATDYETTGYIRTGFIRFNTLEPKRFQFVTVRGSGSGTLGIETYDVGAATTSIATVDPLDGQDYDLGRGGSDEYLALKFTLTRGSATTTPIFNSWQVKALPAIRRSRTINVPVLLFDKMRDTKGAQVNVDVHDILATLEDLESDSVPVNFTELCSGTPRTELVTIDEIRYQQVSPPAGCVGDGGIVYLTLRTVQ